MLALMTDCCSDETRLASDSMFVIAVAVVGVVV